MAFPKQRLIKYWVLMIATLLLIPLLQQLDQASEQPPGNAETQPTVAVAAYPSIKQTEQRLPSSAQPNSLPIERWKTENGASVLFLAAPELPMVDIRLLFDAGSARDGALPGLAQFTNGMLAEGTQSLSADQIAAGFEALGAQFSNNSHRDMALLSLRSLSQPESLQPALTLFTDVLANPAFASADIARLRAQAIAYLRYQAQQPDQQASQAFFQALYTEHPYAHPSLGTKESLQQIDHSHLRAFHQQFYVASNLTIALVGQLELDDAKQLAEQISQTLPAGNKPAPLPTVANIAARTEHIPFPTEQTTIRLGTLGIGRHDPNYPALYLANHILGGSGFSARLMQELREARGLTYGISSGFTPMHAPGPFSISLKTRNDQTKQALTVIQEQLDLFAAQGPSAQELDDAKRNILGSYPLGVASNGSLVSQLGVIGFYDLPSDHLQRFLQAIAELNQEQVRTAFAKILHQSPWIQITVGQTEEAH